MIFVDFHHNSLLRSLVMLFENRLGMSVYRPIGMEWFNNGYWAINNQIDTARQFLDIECTSLADNTPLLNTISSQETGIYHVYDPGNLTTHKAIKFDTFKEMKFDFIIASIPQHIQVYEELIHKYQPQARLIVQVGNNWSDDWLFGRNVLASVKPKSNPRYNAMYYHQEFDLNIFNFSHHKSNKKISSYINILQYTRYGWDDFVKLETELAIDGYDFRSYGGQCRDGNFAGPVALANSMKDNDMVFHVKHGGDGYGHILYNAYACGKPTIIRSSFYKNQLAEELFSNKNCIDLDKMSIDDAINKIKSISTDEDLLNSMSVDAYNHFKAAVDFEEESKKINEWLNTVTPL
ncbi:hypothetical protein EB001_00120 [bacterium]|nr:hypothetical protein [bacterium]